MTRPAANRGGRGEVREGSWAEPSRPLIPRARGASPENFSPNCPGNVRGRERGLRSQPEAGGAQLPGRKWMGWRENCPSPQAPKPSRSQTFPGSSSPHPREPGILGMENSERRISEPGGGQAGGRPGSRREADRRGAGSSPLAYFFFFTRVGVGCFLVALEETKEHSRNGTFSPPHPQSRHGTPSPRGPARSAGVGKLAARPQPGSPAPAASPTPTRPCSARLRGGHANSGRPSSGWRAGEGEGNERGAPAGAPGAQWRGGRPPAAGPRSPGRSPRGLTQSRAARRAEPAPRPAYWASARRDRGLQQITN